MIQKIDGSDIREITATLDDEKKVKAKELSNIAKK